MPIFVVASYAAHLDPQDQADMGGVVAGPWNGVVDLSSQTGLTGCLFVGFVVIQLRQST